MEPNYCPPDREQRKSSARPIDLFGSPEVQEGLDAMVLGEEIEERKERARVAQSLYEIRDLPLD